MKALTAVVVALLVVVLASGASARTWRVEKDSSGDFTVIQDAVDAAASGDTILIGPGRYNEGRVYSYPGWTEFVRVNITKPELTLIGSGNTTIIGQEEPWSLEQGSHKGIAALAIGGNSVTRIMNLQVENVRDGINIDSTDTVLVKNCTFRDNYYSMILGNRHAIVSGCEFDGVARDGTHIFSWHQDSVEVNGSAFTLAMSAEWNQGHMRVEGAQGGAIDRCIFNGGAVGLSISSGDIVTVRRASFYDIAFTAIFIGIGDVAVEVDSSTFCRVRQGFRSTASDNSLSVEHSVLRDVTDASIVFSWIGPTEIHDCDLARGADFIVRAVEEMQDLSPVILDLTNNYWGTDNPDSIRAWIHDGNDFETCYFVEFEPFRSESTPAESKSLGALKSLFR